MKYKLPIKIPVGCVPYISQPYGETSNAEWYKKNGIEIPFHNGVDIAIKKIGGSQRDNNIATYGCSVVAWEDMTRDRVFFDTPMATKGNGIYMWGKPYEEDGVIKQIFWVFWHASQVATLKTKFTNGEEIMKLGNSGLVFPEPTDSNPFAGSHLHLMAFMFHNGVLQNADNGVGGAIDPMQFIDLNNFYIFGDWQDVNDTLPLSWVVGRLIEKIMLKLRK